MVEIVWGNKTWMEGYKKRSIKETEGKDRTYSPGFGLNTVNMVMKLWVP